MASKSITRAPTLTPAAGIAPAVPTGVMIPLLLNFSTKRSASMIPVPGTAASVNVDVNGSALGVNTGMSANRPSFLAPSSA